MKFNAIGYLIKEGFVGLYRNKMMFLATVATIVLSLLLVGASYVIVENAEYIMDQAESNFGITVYLGEELTQKEVSTLYEDISSMPNVLSVEHISKEEALKIFSEDSGGTELFEAFQSDNPLPASFEIQVNQLNNQEDIINKLSLIDGLELSYLESEAASFLNLKNGVQSVSIGIILVLILISLMLMSNTIKLTLHIRSKEINIMKYIGATNMFIRLPLVVEGAITGIVGAIIPIGIVASVYSKITPVANTMVSGMIQGVHLKEARTILQGYVPLCLWIGIGIGILGSIFAVKKYLDV